MGGGGLTLIIFLAFFYKKYCLLKKSLYICSSSGEKSGTADALAYYFALTEVA